MAANLRKLIQDFHICTSLASRSFQTSSQCYKILENRREVNYPFPSNKKGRWVPRPKVTELYEYTTEPVRIPKVDGRGPNGRIWNHRRGSGILFPFHMIDWIRGGPKEGNPLVEQVKEIKECKWRSAHIALLASGERKRWVIATHNMKVGDLVKSSQELTRTAVRPNEGDSYPVGSLPIGTLVSSIQAYPNDVGHFATAAGVSAMVVRKINNGTQVAVRLPSKREICIAAECTATVGRVSNIDHNKEHWGKAGAKRLANIRPRSGRWHRKDGRFGRKIRPVKKMKTYVERPAPPVPSTPFSKRAGVPM